MDQTSSSNLSTAITISSAFLNNTAPSGGAIHIITSSNNISIHNSLFEGNAAPSGESTDPLIAEGGAITIVDIAGTSASQLQLTNSTIQHNWADLGSGGVSLDGVQGLLVQSCIFLNNSAVTDPDYAGPGALSFTATCHRAAAQVKSGATEPVLLACQAGFVDSVFQDNFAAVDGAVLLTQNGFLVYMTTTRFATNQALWGTGAISMLQAALDAAGSILLMSEMLFQGNEVTNQTSDTKLDTYNSGAIYLSDVSCFAVVDSNFDSNTGWSFITGVGALNVDKLAGDPEECYRQTKASLPPSLSFYPELFDPTHLLVSTPDQPDGYLQATSADIRNTSFTNHYGGLAGCIELGRSFDPNATFSYCTFHNNTSAGPAGSLMSWLGPYLLVTQCNFTDQHADYDGGAIYTKRAGLEVNGSHFQNCSATRSGGAMATEKAQLIITHSSVRDSSAGPQGGGVAACVACAAVVFTQSDFFNNTSDNVGGVLKADTDTRVIVFKQVQAIGNR